MLDKKLDRRDFISSVMKILAITTGLSVNQVHQLIAGNKEMSMNIGSSGLQRYSIYQKSSDKAIKNLKVLIEDSKRIFESEFGRITPVERVKDPEKPGDYLIMCRVEWGSSGNIIDSCGSHYEKGGTCGKLKDCENNSCNGQKCPELLGCDILSCSGLGCPTLVGCGSVTLSFRDSFFEKYKSDSYVKHLFERFEVTTSSELATQVKNLLEMR